MLACRGFKALKQTVKLHYRIGNYKEMMGAYKEMLTYIISAVTRNYSEKCINNILDFVSGSVSQNLELLQEFYQTTLRALEEAKNEVGKNHVRFFMLPLFIHGDYGVINFWHFAGHESENVCGLCFLGVTEAMVQNKFEVVQVVV